MVKVALKCSNSVKNCYDGWNWPKDYARRLFRERLDRPVTRVGRRPPSKIFRLPGKMCWTSFKTIGHSSRNLGLSQKTLRPSWCPKLVTALRLKQAATAFWTASDGHNIIATINPWKEYPWTEGSCGPFLGRITHCFGLDMCVKLQL